MADEHPRSHELRVLTPLDHEIDVLLVQFLKFRDCEAAKALLMDRPLRFSQAISSD